MNEVRLINLFIGPARSSPPLVGGCADAGGAGKLRWHLMRCMVASDGDGKGRRRQPTGSRETQRATDGGVASLNFICRHQILRTSEKSI